MSTFKKEDILKEKGTEVAKISLIAYQVKIGSAFEKALVAMVVPTINIQREETKEKLSEFSQKVSELYSEILDFDNAK